MAAGTRGSARATCEDQIKWQWALLTSQVFGPAYPDDCLSSALHLPLGIKERIYPSPQVTAAARTGQPATAIPTAAPVVLQSGAGTADPAAGTSSEPACFYWTDT